MKIVFCDDDDESLVFDKGWGERKPWIKDFKIKILIFSSILHKILSKSS